MNTAFNLPPAKRDGELLDTATANKLIEAVNRLAAIQVQTVRASGMVKSGLLVSKENAVLALAYRDAANVLGTAATIDLVTPYSGRRGTRVQNGRSGSGGTILINGDGDIQAIPSTRSGGIGTRKTATGAVVKVDGVQKTISSIFIMIGGAYIQFGFSSVSYLTLPTIPIDGTMTPYADLTTAQDALTNKVANCITEYSPYNGPGQTRNSISASQNLINTVVSLNDSLSGFFTNSNMLIVFRLTAGGNVSIGYNVVLTGATGGSVSADLYRADQTTLQDSDFAVYGAGGGSGTLTVTVPDNADYYLLLGYGGDGTDLTVAFTVTPPAADLILGLVRAAWDNGGTTEYVYC